MTTRPASLSGIARPRHLLLARVIWVLFVLASITVFLFNLTCVLYMDGVDAVVQSLTLAPVQRVNGALQVTVGVTFVLDVVVVVGYLVTAMVIGFARSDSAIALLTSWTILTTVLVASPLLVQSDNLPRWWMLVRSGYLAFYAAVAVYTVIVQPDNRMVYRWRLAVPLIAGGWLFLSAYDVPFYDTIDFPVRMGITVALIAILIYRYRQELSQKNRQQIKWFIYGLLAFIIYALTDFSAQTATDLFELPPGVVLLLDIVVGYTLLLPAVSIAFALIGARLYDIDVVINRSLVYGILIALALTFLFVMATVLQLLSGGTQPLIAIFVTAIISGLVFRPLQRRVQRFVDRQVFRLRIGYNEIWQSNLKRQTERGLFTEQQFGPYHLGPLLGEGGMGAVYSATDASGDTLAIKLMSEDLINDENALTRFEREADLLGLLHHPNIVQVYEYNFANGVPYIAMDYVNGFTLANWLKQKGTLPVEEALPLLVSLADAMDYLHAQGIIHRDIKPGNLMMRDRGDFWELVLMDFGLVKLRSSVQVDSGLIGTIGYISPEQIREHGTVDHRADIYALGVTLYEAFTGQKPFDGGMGQLLFKHLNEPPPDARNVNPELPVSVATALTRAMAKAPTDRYNTARAFVDDMH